MILLFILQPKGIRKRSIILYKFESYISVEN